MTKRVTAGPYTLELPPNGVAILYEADESGMDHRMPGGVGYLEALVQFDSTPYRVSWSRNHNGELNWCTANYSFIRGYITDWFPLPMAEEGQ